MSLNIKSISVYSQLLNIYNTHDISQISSLPEEIQQKIIQRTSTQSNFSATALQNCIKEISLELFRGLSKTQQALINRRINVNNLSSTDLLKLLNQNNQTLNQLGEIENILKTSEDIEVFIKKVQENESLWKLLPLFITALEIKEESQRCAIALAFAQKDAKTTACYIKNFRINNQADLIKIAKLCIANDIDSVFKNIKNFNLNTNSLIEILQFSADLDPGKIVLWIRNNIKNPQNNQLIQNILIKCAVRSRYCLHLIFDDENKKMLSEPLEQLAAFACYTQLTDLIIEYFGKNSICAKYIEAIKIKHNVETKNWIARLLLVLIINYKNNMPKMKEANFLKMISELDSLTASDRNFIIDELAKDPNNTNVLEKFVSNQSRKKACLNAILHALETSGISKEATAAIKNNLAPLFTNNQISTLLDVLYALYNSSSLSVEQKEKAILLLCKDPLKKTRERKKDYLQRLPTIKKELNAKIQSLFVIIFSEETECPINCQSIAEWEQWVIEKKMNAEKHFADSFLVDRAPKAFITFKASLQSLRNPDVNQDVDRYMNSVLNGSFKQERYLSASNVHLRTIEKSHDEIFNQWQEALDPVDLILPCENTSQPSVHFKVVDTDDHLDLLLAATEVPSCLAVSRHPDFSKGLLGYILDGKNRLIAIKNEKGQIVARAKLSLLWDGESLFLFLEQVYTNGDFAKQFIDAIQAMALAKAKSLGIPLTSYASPSGQSFDKDLMALESGVSYECCDIIGSTVKNGQYLISKKAISIID